MGTTKPNGPTPEKQPIWSNRIVGYGDADPSELASHPNNWRVHPEHQTDAMEGVLDEVGWIDPVTVSKRTGTVLDGHMRVALAIKHRLPTVPVVYVDLTEDEERKALATFNSIGTLAYDDRHQLSALISSIEFKDKAVSDLLDRMLGVQDPDGSGEDPSGSGATQTSSSEPECKYPIVPRFSEKYDYVIVFATNEIDWNWLCERLGLKQMASYKSTDVGLGRVIHVDKFREITGL